MVIGFRSANLLLAILLLCCLVERADAYIYQFPPCVSAGRAEAAFVGRVIKNVHQSRPAYPYTQFEVIESFFGISEPQVSVHRIPSCVMDTLDFKEGEIYLVYANGFDGILLTDRCRYGTRELASAAEDIAYLRQQMLQPDRVKLSGVVSEKSIKVNSTEQSGQLLKDIQIRIKDSNNRYFDVTTDERGYYEVNDLAPGQYQAYPLVTENFIQEDQISGFTIPERGCVQQDFQLTPNGRIDGRVFDANNRPVAGVRVYLQPVNIKKNVRSNETLHAHTDASGNYLIEKVPSGKYLLGFYLMPSPDNYEPIEPLYFPGVQGAKQAIELNVGLGEALNNYNLTLSPQLTLWRLNGRVVWSDGSPVTGAVISLHDQSYPQLVANTANSDLQGNFSFKIYSEIAYYVNVKLTLTDEKTKQSQVIEAEPQSIQLTGDISDFQIVLVKPKKRDIKR